MRLKQNRPLRRRMEAVIIATIVSTVMCGSELRDQSTSNAHLAGVFPVSSVPTLHPDPTPHICQKHELIALLHLYSHCAATARRRKLRRRARKQGWLRSASNASAVLIPMFKVQVCTLLSSWQPDGTSHQSSGDQSLFWIKAGAGCT